MGVPYGSCNFEKYSSIKKQFVHNTLLVGLEPNSNMNELNALLQCLSHIEPLVNYIKYTFKKKVNYSGNKEKFLIFTFADLINKLWPNNLMITNYKEVNTYKEIENSNNFLKMIYKINPQYNINKDYLINFILLRLNGELNQIDKNNYNTKLNFKSTEEPAFHEYYQKFEDENRSIISKLFYGIYNKISKCNNCGNQYYKYESYIYGLYNLSQVYNYKCQTLQRGSNVLYINKPYNISQITIYDCLYYDQQMKYNQEICKKCSVETPHVFQNIIYNPPEILTFIFNKADIINNIFFVIPEKINIKDFIANKEDKIYELIGIIIYFHPNSYTAYCQNPIDKQWYHYQDTNVYKMNNFQEITKNNYIPYVLFYQQSKS